LTERNVYCRYSFIGGGPRSGSKLTSRGKGDRPAYLRFKCLGEENVGEVVDRVV
jgi:hypothetical protein